MVSIWVVISKDLFGQLLESCDLYVSLIMLVYTKETNLFYSWNLSFAIGEYITDPIFPLEMNNLSVRKVSQLMDI